MQLLSSPGFSPRGTSAAEAALERRLDAALKRCSTRVKIVGVHEFETDPLTHVSISLSVDDEEVAFRRSRERRSLRLCRTRAGNVRFRKLGPEPSSSCRKA